MFTSDSPLPKGNGCAIVLTGSSHTASRVPREEGAVPGSGPAPGLPSPAVTKGHTRAGTGLGSRASHPQHHHGSHKSRVKDR